MDVASLDSLPSVEKVLQTGEAEALAGNYGRTLTVRAVREALNTLRLQIQSRDGSADVSVSSIIESTSLLLGTWTQAALRPVINATGVILHTNLGRAPLSNSTIAAMTAVGHGYSSVELDLTTGKRGRRGTDAEDALKMLTGADAALVVNNNAAAVLLVLSALASRKRVAIARSQLVEIGGGFRMPDVMRQSGARLLEVGTTNRVRLSDYEEVFSQTSVVLRVHRSNFKMIGFTEEPDLRSLVRVADGAGQIVVDDLGSGAVIDSASYGLAHEPMVQESLEAGADIVCFSGDKMLGGPQAGIIVGKSELVAKLVKHPLARAIRADKLTLAGLRATLNHYLLNEAEQQIPVWRMISASLDELDGRARAWAKEVEGGEVIVSESTLGGGSLPGETLPTRVLALRKAAPDSVLRALRTAAMPIIGRAERGQVLLDPRTVLPEEDAQLITTLRTSLPEAS